MSIQEAAPAEVVDRVIAAYRAYSEQRLDDLAALFTPDVDYPDGDRRLAGIEAVRAYWAEQWTRTRTVDVPTAVALLFPDVVAVGIDQVVRGLDGHEISAARVVHLLRLDGERFSRLDIVPV